MASSKYENSRLMITHRSKKGSYPKEKPVNFYQKNFALAILNWEMNRQEERMTMLKTMHVSK